MNEYIMNEDILIQIAEHLPFKSAINLSLAFPQYARLAQYMVQETNRIFADKPMCCSCNAMIDMALIRCHKCKDHLCVKCVNFAQVSTNTWGISCKYCHNKK